MLDLDYLNLLRRLEIERVLPTIPQGCRVLEFGSGTGEQARFLTERGFNVTAIDLASSNYAQHRVFPVTDYDGHRIPLDDRSIDVIFSSNVLEHVENFDEIAHEFRRVLKPEGFAVHVLPTTAWRLWSFGTGVADSLAAAAGLPGALIRAPENGGRRPAVIRQLRRAASGFIPRAHGTSGNGIAELWTFSRHAWRQRFERTGFDVVTDWPIGMFYTGTILAGAKLRMEWRRKLSRIFGSATRTYVVRPSHRD
jgi:SAM-dependent methyltransferase